jgi:site-specific DNA recombinase
VRFAFYGRVSTDDAQDPSLSIPRQLASCKRVVDESGGKLVAYFWDIESGRKNLNERGNGVRGDRFAIVVPRDGGVHDLLAAAPSGNFDAVIVESIDRLSRMTADATQIERELEQLDVALFATDEPMTANATAVLTRRVKQGVAEWYVRDLIEKSRRGMEESVRQGWHTGGPVPYGYQLEPHPHPNPHKAREGKKKHRLIPDPVRAPIVHMIFEDYCLHGLGLGALCDKLNRDLERYPAPARNKKDEMSLPPTWSRAQLQAMLRNPKYTGFNVWGRHDKRRGRPFIRPREQWIRSPEPTHEALIPKELFDLVEQRASHNERHAKLAAPKQYVQRTGRRGGRLYPLRGRVRCGLCGRRMEGSYQKGANWYRCQFVNRRGLAAADAAGHPRVLGIKEDVILEALFDFLTRRLFAPGRLQLLRDGLAGTLAGSWHDYETELTRRRRDFAAIERSLHRQALRLEEHDDPAHPVIALAKHRIIELTAERDKIEGEISALQARPPADVHPETIETLLAAVPDLSAALADYDDAELAELFNDFDIEVTYNKHERTLQLAATLALGPPPETPRPPTQRSRNSDIAGAGFEPATSGL